MNFYSLNKQAPSVSFKEAVIAGIAPDKGLYFPERITPLPSTFFNRIEELSNQEIAFTAIHQFVNENLTDEALKEILAAMLDFEFPVVAIEENVGTLELFHGPTMAFKDVGARFMANCLGHFSKGNKEEVTVLVATSGDTGGAVANGFLGVKGVNVARWLPQLFYFLFAYKQAKSKGKEIVFSIPSGNFGNVCAGMVAQQLGMPVTHFIAATNVNDTVPKYMVNGTYHPKPSTATISNAMDVGDPSNFVRIRNIYNNDFKKLKENLSSFSFNDATTKEAMESIYKNTRYICDPHGAVGYLGLKKYQENNPNTYGVFLETAHPVKFLDVVKETLKINLEIPPQIQKVMNKQKSSTKLSTYQELKSYLLDA